MSNETKWKAFVDLLREKINLFIKGLNFSKEEKKECFKLFSNKGFNKMNEHLDEFDQNNEKLCRFVDNLDLLKDEAEKSEGKAKLLKNGLDSKLVAVLEEIENTEVDKDIALTYLRQKIRTIQNEHIASYMRIYKMKDKVKKLDSSKSEFEKEIQDIHEMLLPLKSLYRSEYHFVKKGKEEIPLSA